MARPNRWSAKDLSADKPVLTGENHSDHALWQLATIFAEIAEQATRDTKNDGDEHTEVNPTENEQSTSLSFGRGCKDD